MSTRTDLQVVVLQPRNLDSTIRPARRARSAVHAAERSPQPRLKKCETPLEDIELIIAAEKRILAERGIVASAYCRQPRYELDRDELTMIDRFLAMFGGQLESPTA